MSSESANLGDHQTFGVAYHDITDVPISADQYTYLTAKFM
jgi:hypothetical protein